MTLRAPTIAGMGRSKADRVCRVIANIDETMDHE
jgi:hypothetical protein